MSAYFIISVTFLLPPAKKKKKWLTLLLDLVSGGSFLNLIFSIISTKATLRESFHPERTMEAFPSKGMHVT